MFAFGRQLKRGLVAIGEIEQIHPDLIILDIIFDEHTSGWDMLRLLKMQPTTTHIPIIICSAALGEVQTRARDLIAQGVRILYKPFDLDDCLVMIKQALAERQKETQIEQDEHK